MDNLDSKVMEFVSKALKVAKTVAVLPLFYAALGISPKYAPKAYIPEVVVEVKNDVPENKVEPYAPKPNVRSVAAHYFPPGVVAFTVPEDGEVAMPPIERVPYENGVHSWRFVLDHELMHNYIHKASGIQNERGINDHVAGELRGKYGNTGFPFASY